MGYLITHIQYLLLRNKVAYKGKVYKKEKTTEVVYLLK